MKQRYYLQPSQEDEGWFVLTDAKYGVVIKFKEHEFNETQKACVLDGNALQGLSPAEIAGVARELADWGAENHYEVLMPAPQFPYDVRLKIGRRIAQLRQERGLTLRQLAELCGVGYANICKIEQGRYSTTLDLLAKIADALGAKIEIN